MRETKRTCTYQGVSVELIRQRLFACWGETAFCAATCSWTLTLTHLQTVVCVIVMSRRGLTPPPRLTTHPPTLQLNVSFFPLRLSCGLRVFSPKGGRFNKTSVLVLARSCSRVCQQRAKYVVLWRSGGLFFLVLQWLIVSACSSGESNSFHKACRPMCLCLPSPFNLPVGRVKPGGMNVLWQFWKKLNLKWKAPETFFIITILVTSVTGYWWLGVPGFQKANTNFIKCNCGNNYSFVGITEGGKIQ